jgi:hypothetical protein
VPRSVPRTIGTARRPRPEELQLQLNSRERIEDVFGQALGHAQRSGDVRTDVDESDLMQLIGGMCSIGTLSLDQSERLLSMILGGLRQTR